MEHITLPTQTPEIALSIFFILVVLAMLDMLLTSIEP